MQFMYLFLIIMFPFEDDAWKFIYTNNLGTVIFLKFFFLAWLVDFKLIFYNKIKLIFYTTFGIISLSLSLSLSGSTLIPKTIQEKNNAVAIFRIQVITASHNKRSRYQTSKNISEYIGSALTRYGYFSQQGKSRRETFYRKISLMPNKLNI